jgi:cyclopropane-fatty-acyl-phospholipid synthase
MEIVLDRIGRKFRQGCLEFRAADGRVWTLGRNEPRAVLRLNDPAALFKILLNPELHFGEAYMDGAWEPADGDLRHVIEVAVCMVHSMKSGPLETLLQRAVSWLGELNNPLRSRRNVHHHYDLDYDLYSTFLDREMYYSCAYFNDAGREEQMTLEAAQQAKCAHIAAKLDLKPGARVLDIGCGWGSLALDLAQRFDARVVGITLSQEQLGVARQRAHERGLDRQVEFRLEDYRDTRGEFDAIVSVGMFEHVGRPQYRNFFQQVHDLLALHGTALLHTIGRTGPPGGCNSWIRKYIFPGGYIPAASEVMAAIEPKGLILTDFEVWRLHYARTLAEWNRRFQANRSRFAEKLGERFCRMWEFYLLASEASFRWGDLVVFHAQMERSLGRLPLTRDYLYGADRRRKTVMPIRKRG